MAATAIRLGQRLVNAFTMSMVDHSRGLGKPNEVTENGGNAQARTGQYTRTFVNVT